MSAKNKSKIYAKIVTSSALREHLFCFPGDHESPVLITLTGFVMRMPLHGTLYNHLNSGAYYIVPDEKEQEEVNNTNWVDTTNMPTGRGLKRLMNQCSNHPSTPLGFGPRISVPLTKQQLHKLIKQKRFVEVRTLATSIIAPPPTQPSAPRTCLPYRPSYTPYPEGKRRYTGVRSKHPQPVVVTEVCPPARPHHSKTLQIIDNQIAKQKAWKRKSEREPTMFAADKPPTKHSARKIDMQTPRCKVHLQHYRFYVCSM